MPVDPCLDLLITTVINGADENDRSLAHVGETTRFFTIFRFAMATFLGSAKNDKKLHVAATDWL